MNHLDALSDRILASFRKGNDTLDIARSMHLAEAQVSRLLWVARCREKGLPATFMNQAREVKQIAPKAA